MNRLLCGVMISIFVPVTGAAADLQLHEKLKPLAFQWMGPFAHTSDGGVIAINGQNTYVTTDDGATWSDARPIFSEGQQPRITVSNERAMLRTKDGTLVLACMNLDERNWTWKNELHDAPGAVLPTYVMRSVDDGRTWTNVQKLHDNWSGAVRDMIQTSDGRIVFTAMKMQHNPGRHTVLTYSSVDDGLTWAASNLIDLGGKGHHGGVTEPTLVQLQDGRLWQLIRTNWGQFWSGYSNNGGRHWQILQPSGIPASSAPAMLTRLASGRLMLLWNRPFPEGQTSWPLSGGDGLWSETAVSNYRDQLSLAFSSDDGQTWSSPVVVAAQEKQWLAYPYVFEVEPGRIWLTTMQGKVRAEFLERDFVSE